MWSLTVWSDIVAEGCCFVFRVYRLTLSSLCVFIRVALLVFSSSGTATWIRTTPSVTQSTASPVWTWTWTTPLHQDTTSGEPFKLSLFCLPFSFFNIFNEPKPFWSFSLQICEVLQRSKRWNVSHTVQSVWDSIWHHDQWAGKVVAWAGKVQRLKSIEHVKVFSV